MNMESDEAPDHVQQLQQLAAQLHKDKAESESVTWVPELIPIYVQKAVEYVLAQAGEGVSWLPAVLYIHVTPWQCCYQLKLLSPTHNQNQHTQPTPVMMSERPQSSKNSTPRSDLLCRSPGSNSSSTFSSAHAPPITQLYDVHFLS
jgi:hypothetical protein